MNSFEMELFGKRGYRVLPFYKKAWSSLDSLIYVLDEIYFAYLNGYVPSKVNVGLLFNMIYRVFNYLNVKITLN